MIYKCPNGCEDPKPAWWDPPAGSTLRGAITGKEKLS